MHDIHYYQLEVQECIDENDFNAGSPLRITVICRGPGETHLGVDTYQSGLVGLIRHLHHQGVVLLALCRTRKAAEKENANEC